MKRLKKSLKNILKYIIIILIILSIPVLGPVLFYEKLENGTPLPGYYRKGVYHMHSVFSDGKGTVEEITGAALGAGMDFVILTDHGRPNIESASSTAWKNGVLLMGGSELSLYSGHLAAVGFNVPGYIFPPEPQDAVDEIVGDGGVCFVAHPFDDKIPWSDWRVKGFTGLEVLSCYSSARKASILRLLAFPARYWVNSNYALTGTLSYPAENMEKWYELNRRGDGFCYYGIFALDAHAKLPVTKGFQLNYPTYAAMFEIMTVYVKVGNMVMKSPVLASRQVVEGLKKGNFFNVIESIAPANGFECWFEDMRGSRTEMGGRTESSAGKLVLTMPFEFDTEVLVKRDGRDYKRVSVDKRKELEIPVDGKGFYHMEIYASGHLFDDLPWILTNPFFVGRAETGVVDTNPVNVEACMYGKALREEEVFFKVERNEGSDGELNFKEDEEGGKATRLTFKLGKDAASGKNFWSAMAARREFDFSGWKGLGFYARSDVKRRVWVEFRTGTAGKDEVWFKRSVLLEPEWNLYCVPFDEFYLTFSETDKENNLKNKARGLMDTKEMKFTAFFFSVNNANAYEGAEGWFEVKQVGIY